MEHDRNVLFQGAIPENYDRYLGPVMFVPWAEDLVLRLAGAKYERVLEIACGTGIVSRRLRDALPATTEIIATDLNPDMFEFAKRKFRKDEKITWQQADASALPFPNCSFDAAVCQFGVMFVPDKAAAMRESYRVLRSGGLVRGNPVVAEATERGVDPEDLIEAVAKQIAKALGSAPVESTMRVIVWQAMKS